MVCTREQISGLYTAVHVCFWLCKVPHDPGNVLHIVWTEQATLRMIIVSIIRTFYGGSARTKFTLSFKSYPRYPRAAPPKLWTISCKLSITKLLLSPFVYYSPSLLPQDPRQGELTPVLIIFFFHVVGACTGFCFQRRLSFFSLPQCCLQIPRSFLFRSSSLQMQIVLGSSSRREEPRLICICRC